MHDSHTLPFFIGHRTDEDIMFCQMLDIVKEQPAADVVEVVHGEWIFNRGQAYGEPLYFCSVCTDGGSEWGKDKYCPNCGAKMDGKGGQTNEPT